MAGDSRKVNDDFYVQSTGHTLVVVHARKSHYDTEDVGVRVERLLTGEQSLKFYSASIFQIGGHRVMVTSEVDARSEDGGVTEIKASTKGAQGTLRGHSLPVQLICNGSTRLVSVTVDTAQKQVNAIEWFNTEDILEKKLRDRTIHAGQRICFVLDLILRLGLAVDSSDCGGGNASEGRSLATGPVFKLTFEKNTEGLVFPIAKRAHSGVTILPVGL